MASSSQEEILDSELDVDDDGEISEDLEEGDSQDLNPDNLEGTTDEDDNNCQDDEVEVNSEEDIEVDQPESVVEDNSSEPSSSTGTRQLGRGIAAGSGSNVVSAGAGYDHDQGDTDSVVPTTPKLPLPRRNDGFAEAVSSPQVK